MKTSLLAVSLVLLAHAAAAAQSVEAAAAASTITQDDYARRIGIIAADSMQGRNTPSAGLDKTAEWIASEFRGFGLRGGAQGGAFVQRYPLVEIVVDADASSVGMAGGPTLRYGADVVPMRGGADADVSGPLVVVTGDMEAAALVKADLRGKHVALIPSEAMSANRRALFGLVGSARTAGAASVLISVTEDDRMWSSTVAAALRPTVGRPTDPQAPGPAMAPALYVRAASLAPILQRAGLSLERLARAGGGEVTAVPGVTLALTQRVRTSPRSAPNVVGILEGSDPVLKDEYVVLSAHMDHVGIGTPDQNGDSIFNGADDDASGTIAVVEIAQAMASMHPAPRRSVIFLLVSGEEKGLWGSEYYVTNPSVPLAQAVADLNADMVGRNWPDTIVAIGKEHSDLGATLNRVNAEHPELGMTAIDDKWPEERFYFRSDHYNFARNGVPILFFFNGTHPDYHGRDDEPDRINAEKAARISRLLFWLGVEVANADQRPEWNPESYRQIVTGSGRERGDRWTP